MPELVRSSINAIKSPKDKIDDLERRKEEWKDSSTVKFRSISFERKLIFDRISVQRETRSLHSSSSVQSTPLRRSFDGKHSFGSRNQSALFRVEKFVDFFDRKRFSLFRFQIFWFKRANITEKPRIYSKNIVRRRKTTKIPTI